MFMITLEQMTNVPRMKQERREIVFRFINRMEIVFRVILKLFKIYAQEKIYEVIIFSRNIYCTLPYK